jgi:3-methyladenine DNA glycosylase/8-oxoguanine DNA glycosylase
MARPDRHLAATDALAALDPVLADLVAAHGPMRLGARPPVSARFEALARSIAFQQLAGAAAATIWGRVRALVPGPFTAEAVLAVPDEALAGAGLSGAKRAALQDLALHVVDGRVELDRMGRMPDDEVVAELVQVRGIGTWTAEMFLLFTLHRLDVWPVTDLGVRNGYARAFGLDAPPAPKELQALGERFRPHRSVVAWYCWRAADTRTP